MSDRRLGIGLIGYAHLHAPRYAAAIAAHPQARLTAIVGWGANADVARAEAVRYGVPYLEDPAGLPAVGTEAVYLGSTPVEHRPLVEWAAGQGLHVLCDKPIATTLADADAVIAACRQAGVQLMVPFNPRFQLPLQKVKEALTNGEAGELVSVYAVKYGRLPTKAPGPQRADWFLDPQQAGGGGFLDIGIHAVDALCWLAAAPPVRVYAVMNHGIHGLAAEDLGTMTVEFANGVVGVLSAGWANPDSWPAWLDVRFEVLTTKRAYRIDRPYHDFALFGPDRAERRAWWRKDIEGLVDAFVRAVLAGHEPPITGEDARRALAVVLAAYRSSQTGEVTTLAPDA